MILAKWFKSGPACRSAQFVGAILLSCVAAGAAHADDFGGEVHKYVEHWKAPNSGPGPGTQIEGELRFYFHDARRRSGNYDADDMARWTAQRNSLKNSGLEFQFSNLVSKTPGSGRPQTVTMPQLPPQPGRIEAPVFRDPNNRTPERPRRISSDRGVELPDPGPSGGYTEGGGEVVSVPSFIPDEEVLEIPSGHVLGQELPPVRDLPPTNFPRERPRVQPLREILFGGIAPNGPMVRGKYYRINQDGEITSLAGTFEVSGDDMRMWPGGGDDEIRVLLNAAPTATRLDAEYAGYHAAGLNRDRGETWTSTGSGKINFDLGGASLTASIQQRHQVQTDDQFGTVTHSPPSATERIIFIPQ